jgi:transcription elongation factor GreB
MNKAFVREDAPEDEEDPELARPAGRHQELHDPRGPCPHAGELAHLVRVERPEVVNIVSWAAGNGDRSENGDYIYGKKRCGKSTGASAS